MRQTLDLYIYRNKVIASGVTPQTKELIDRVTRFKPKDSDWWTSVREGTHDGIIHLFRDSSFPIGLLEDVTQLLELYEIEYQIKDVRTFPRFQKLDLDAHLRLRGYQIEAVERALTNKSGIIALPTGSGKTIIAMEIIRRLKLPTIFFVNRKELLYQTQNFFKALFGVNAGLIGDNNMELKPITVAMIQTATNLPAKLFAQFPLIFVDEAHHTPAETIYRVISKSEAEFKFGLTATPRREDGKDMLITACLGKIIYSATLSELIDRGFLAKPHVHAIGPLTPMTFQRRAKYPEVCQQYIIFNSERNKLIAATAVEASVNGPTYVHVRWIDHGKVLTKMIANIVKKEPSRKVVFICGKDSSKKRIETIEAFKRKEIAILVSTLLGEGIDIPNLQSLILASPMKSLTSLVQVFGRLLRISEYPIVDFYDCWDRCKFLYDHWIERVKFYQSERSFTVDKRILQIGV